MDIKMLSLLRDELEKSNTLLKEASRLAAPIVKEDGTRTPTTKKPRKKQKLTPDQKKKQKKDQKLVKKVKDKLKDRKYKSRKTNKELSFNTALNRNHPKAQQDFNREMKKMRGGKPSKKDDEKTVSYTKTLDSLNEEQRDVIDRIVKGDLDIDDMPLVAERTLRESLIILSEIHQRLSDEGLKPEPQPKKRKTRSDKGKKRGPYKKRVKKEIEAEIPKEVEEHLDTDALVDIEPQDVGEIKEVLDERAYERVEQTGQEEPEEYPVDDDTTLDDDTTIDEAIGLDFFDIDFLDDDDGVLEEALNKSLPPPLPKADPIPLAPLAEQPSYVQKEEIKDRLEKSFKEALDPEGISKKIKDLKDILEDTIDDEAKAELEERIKELEGKEPLASTRKETKTIRNQINASVDALDDLTENQVKTMMEFYGTGAGEVNDILRERGLQGLQNHLKSQLKSYEEDGIPSPPPSLESLKEKLQKEKDKAVALVHDLEEAKAKKKLLSEKVKELRGLNEKQREVKIKELSEDVDVVDLFGEHNNPFAESSGEIPNLDDIIKEESSAQDKVKEVSKDLSDTEKDADATLKDVNNYESLQKLYAQKIGTYLSLKNAQEGIIEDPEFGLKEYPSSPSDEEKELQELQVRRSQSERFREMDKDQRNKMVLNISERMDELVNLASDKKLSAKDKKLLEGQINNLKVTQSSLNVVRMINAEGVIQTDPPIYNEVPDHMLELARQTESKAWDSAIAKLSEGGSSPEEVKREIRSVTENLGTEDFKEVVGGDRGPFGDMVNLLDDNYCPSSAVNNTKGVGDKHLGPGEECPNPLSDEMKDLLREYMSDSFVDLYTIEKETRRDTDRWEEKSDQVSKRVKDNMRYFWKERKDKFFEAFVDGVDESTGKEYTEEERQAVAEEFHMQWKINNMQSLNEGIEIYGDSYRKYRWKELMGELERIKSLDAVEMRKRRKQIKEKLTQMFDDSAKAPSEEDGTKKQGSNCNSLFISPTYKSGGTRIMQKRSSQYVNYQRRSQAFELGMRVYPFYGGNPSRSGVVVAIFPAIGMVDVQFPHGASRFPVEDLVVDTSGDYKNLTNEEASIPGGLGTVPVTSRSVNKQANRVASKYMKKAIYWYKRDRTYRQCRNEVVPCCPKCKDPLGTTVYKRRGGKSEKLLVCRSCLFIIKPSDIIKG